MSEQIIFALMLLTGLYTAISRNFKHVVLALCTLSLLASFCYLLFHAPDVAIAEAVIGCALSTILYIIAIKKHRSFYIYISSKTHDKKSDLRLRADIEGILSAIGRYCTEHELEVQYMFTGEEPEHLVEEHVFDLILYPHENIVTIYGFDTEKHVHSLEDVFKDSKHKDKVKFVHLSREEDE